MLRNFRLCTNLEEFEEFLTSDAVKEYVKEIAIVNCDTTCIGDNVLKRFGKAIAKGVQFDRILMDEASIVGDLHIKSFINIVGRNPESYPTLEIYNYRRFSYEDPLGALGEAGKEKFKIRKSRYTTPPCRYITHKELEALQKLQHYH